jgi:hypothetical protein
MLVSGAHQEPLAFRSLTATPRSSSLAWLRLHAQPANQERKMRIDVYQKITDQIVLELEKGVMQRNLHDWKRMGLG